MFTTCPIHPNRRGAALLIALVLLAFIGVIASLSLPQMLRDRQEAQMELLRQQARSLLEDALRNAEAQRQTDSGFSGETFLLGPEHQPFGGTFRVTTHYQNDCFNAKVEHRNEKGNIVMACTHPADFSPTPSSQP